MFSTKPQKVKLFAGGSTATKILPGSSHLVWLSQDQRMLSENLANKVAAIQESLGPSADRSPAFPPKTPGFGGGH